MHSTCAIVCFYGAGVSPWHHAARSPVEEIHWAWHRARSTCLHGRASRCLAKDVVNGGSGRAMGTKPHAQFLGSTAWMRFKNQENTSSYPTDPLPPSQKARQGPTGWRLHQYFPCSPSQKDLLKGTGGKEQVWEAWRHREPLRGRTNAQKNPGTEGYIISIPRNPVVPSQPGFCP